MATGDPWEAIEAGLRGYLALCGLQLQLARAGEPEALEGLLAEKDRQLAGLSGLFATVGDALPEPAARLAEGIAAREAEAVRLLQDQLLQVRRELEGLAQERKLTTTYRSVAPATGFFLDRRD